jgi:hypothetical protein
LFVGLLKRTMVAIHAMNILSIMEDIVLSWRLLKFDAVNEVDNDIMMNYDRMIYCLHSGRFWALGILTLSREELDFFTVSL